MVCVFFVCFSILFASPSSLKAHTKTQNNTPFFGCMDTLDRQPFTVAHVGLSPHQSFGAGRHIYFVSDQRNRNVHFLDSPIFGNLSKQIPANIIIFSFRNDFVRMVCTNRQNGMLTNGYRRKRVARKIAKDYVRTFHQKILSQCGFKRTSKTNLSNREFSTRNRNTQSRTLQSFGGDETQTKCPNPLRREIPQR